MCNKGIECLSESENPIDQQQPHQAAYLMDSPTASPNFGSNSTVVSSPNSIEDNPRVKFLCSFSGSILPRPQDGKLRYVGGETRIVSVPRDIKYEDLMNKMRELYEGAAVLKYQQPDEDLDALVSIVNDDDVINMMEEYDKLGSGDGFTRLRIFLFSHPDQDGSSHYEGDERDNERKYIDALNNLNDFSDFRKQHPESPHINPVDDVHIAEQFFSPMSLEGGLHNQRSCDILAAQYNLHQLKIPHAGSGQHHQPISHRYNEMEAPWSPGYFSPRHHGPLEPRPMAEFPSSPNSARYRMPFLDIPDKSLDRMPEEFGRQPLNHQHAYEHQPQYSENVVWLPSGVISGEKSGFPGNIFHGTNVLEANSVCEHCRMAFQRSQPHFEQRNVVNGFQHPATPSAECPPNRETFVMNPDAKLHHEICASEQNNGLPPLYNETHNHERGWIPHHHLNSRVEESRPHISGAGKLNDHYVVDGHSMALPLGTHNMVDGQHVSSNYVHQRAGPEIGNDVFHDRPVAAPAHVHGAPPEEHGVCYGNLPYAYGGDNIYSGSHGHVPGHAVWRNGQSPMHATPSYEASISAPQVNGSVNPAYLRHDDSPRFSVSVDNQNLWVDSSQKILGFEGKAVPDYSYDTLKLNPNTPFQENLQAFPPEPIQPIPDIVNCATPVDPASGVVALEESSIEEEKLVNLVDKAENPDMEVLNNKNLSDKACKVAPLESVDPNLAELAEDSGHAVKESDMDHSTSEISKLSVNNLSFIPELIASVKKAALEGAEEVKENVEEGTDPEKTGSIDKEEAGKNLEQVNSPGDGELDSDNDNLNNSKIEPTKAEAEAISKGLQTIRNDDLEEIRELGSGTYGAVYHGKWKGSDVAIKRIKSSCFAGRPSERERLIADFWKEALILSSLHHPNVVSMYGIVRDGPDGSLATVTEFMVNGSLKQFLQKKDRTIDRRKRLIIAMDAAFGMEYLHGKSIVHFDLKCENLLVNMRDPQRPVCKIGDLGLSKVKQQTLVSGGVRGTLPWMAPELLSGKSNMVTEKIDVYSFGIVMWELLTGDEPYTDMHCASIIGGIVNNTLRPQIPTWCDPEWKALMESCWASEPSQRPSFSEISQKLRNMAAAMNVK